MDHFRDDWNRRFVSYAVCELKSNMSAMSPDRLRLPCCAQVSHVWLLPDNGELRDEVTRWRAARCRDAAAHLSRCRRYSCTTFIGREHDNETDLGFYGVRLYEPEYGRFLSTDVLWGEFQNLTPYHYSENSPIVKNDPSGEFPWGVVIGAAVEIASQMIFENRSVSEIDGGRVAIAAGAGGLTGGLSAFSSTATRVAGAAVISVAEGAGKRAVSGEETTVGNVVVDGLIGAGAGRAAESIAKRALGSAEGQLAKDQLRRAENAVADGRPRLAQIARAEAAKEALGNVGRGPKQDAIISCAKEGSDKFLQVVTPVKRDNTSVTQRPIPLKP